MIDGNASSAQAAATVERVPGLVAAAWHFAQAAGALAAIPAWRGKRPG